MVNIYLTIPWKWHSVVNGRGAGESPCPPGGKWNALHHIVTFYWLRSLHVLQLGHIVTIVFNVLQMSQHMMSDWWLMPSLSERGMMLRLVVFVRREWDDQMTAKHNRLSFSCLTD
jgi:hypothetical protein